MNERVDCEICGNQAATKPENPHHVAVCVKCEGRRVPHKVLADRAAKVLANLRRGSSSWQTDGGPRLEPPETTETAKETTPDVPRETT